MESQPRTARMPRAWAALLLVLLATPFILVGLLLGWAATVLDVRVAESWKRGWMR